MKKISAPTINFSKLDFLVINKKIIISFFTFLGLFLGQVANSQVVITEIADPSGTGGGDNRFVEICNIGTSTVDISSYVLRIYINGGNLPDEAPVSGAAGYDGMLAAGECFVFYRTGADTDLDFSACDASDSDGDVNGTGDDVYDLFDGTTVLDVYGVVGTDGTGEPWEYTDDRVIRNTTVTSGNGGIFDFSEWTKQNSTTTAGFDPCVSQFTTALPSISINDVSLDEGDASTTTFSFTITLSATAAADVTFTINTNDGTATVADNDYVAISAATGTITAGALTTTIDVTVNGDTDLESDEIFNVLLSGISANATINDGTGIGTINNDEAGIVPITFNALPDCDNSAGGTGTAANDNSFYVHISTLLNSDGTNPTTFTSSLGTVTGEIATGATSGTILISGLTDANYGSIITLTADNNTNTATVEIPVVICGFLVDNGGNGLTEDDVTNGTFCTEQNGITTPAILVEAAPSAALSSGNDITSTYVYVLVNTSESPTEIVAFNNSGLFDNSNVESGTNYSVYAFNVDDADLTSFQAQIDLNSTTDLAEMTGMSGDFSTFCYTSCWNVPFMPNCFICPTISALTATSPICDGTATTDLTATIANFHDSENNDRSYDVEFVYTTTQAVDAAAVYALTATVIGTEDIAAAGVTSVIEGSFTLPTVATPTTYYIYARIDEEGNIPDAACRPFAETQIIVNPLPTATVSAATTEICFNDTPVNFTFTGTADAVVTYSLDGGTTTTTITLDNTGNATLAASNTAPSTVTLVSVSLPSTTCNQTITGSATINVNPLPTASIALAANSLCSTSSGTDLSISGTVGAEVIYSIDGVNQAAITIEADGTNDIAVNPSATTIYALVSVTNPTTTCNQNLTDAVTLTILDVSCGDNFPWTGNN